MTEKLFPKTCLRFVNFFVEEKYRDIMLCFNYILFPNRIVLFLSHYYIIVIDFSKFQKIATFKSTLMNFLPNPGSTPFSTRITYGFFWRQFEYLIRIYSNRILYSINHRYYEASILIIFVIFALFDRLNGAKRRRQGA